MGGTRRVRNNPGIYSYETKAGRRYAVVVTEGGRQRWRQGFRTLEEAREARQRLGHASVEITLGTYTHPHVDEQRPAARAVAARLRERLGKPAF